jgi:hypothetical protein
MKDQKRDWWDPSAHLVTLSFFIMEGALEVRDEIYRKREREREREGEGEGEREMHIDMSCLQEFYRLP